MCSFWTSYRLTFAKHHVDSTDWALMRADTSISHPLHSLLIQLLYLSEPILCKIQFFSFLFSPSLSSCFLFFRTLLLSVKQSRISLFFQPDRKMSTGCQLIHTMKLDKITPINQEAHLQNLASTHCSRLKDSLPLVGQPDMRSVIHPALHESQSAIQLIN